MSATPPIPELLNTAVEGARHAGRVLADRFGRARTVEFKAHPSDLVTDADKAAEAELLAFLRHRFPDHAVLAEESGLTTGSQQMRWILDPLDGTTNYAHRVPHFCVSVAVEGPEGVLAGAVYDPLRDEMFSAGKGLGATLNGTRLEASAVTALDQSILVTGFPYDVREHPEAPLGLFNRLILRTQAVRRTGSAALDLAYVAAGRFDCYFEFSLKPWDVAAGGLLVQEAGGFVSLVDGSPLDLMVGDVLAAAPGVADELKSECSRFLAEIHWTPRRRTFPAR